LGEPEAFALKSCHGKYLRVGPDGSVKTEREIVQEFETFKRVRLRLRVYALESHLGTYLCAHPHDKVEADSAKIDEWEEWHLHDADEKNVTRDMYGFLVPSPQVEVYSKFVGKYYNKRVPQQRREWKKYLATYDLTKEIQNDSPQLKKLVRTMGIPPEKRRKVCRHSN
jgi:hypothetical protein